MTDTTTKSKNKQIVIIVAVLALAAVAVFALKGGTPSGPTPTDPKEFARASLEDLAKGWDYATFQHYSDDSLEKVVTAETWPKLATEYSKLGSLKEIGECASQEQGNLARIVCPATFEAATATYDVQTVKNEDGMKLTSMFVKSDLFKQKAADEAPAADAPATEAPAAEEPVMAPVEEAPAQE